MQLSRVMAIMLRQVYLLRGSPARFVSLFVWVAVDIILWGFITRYLNNIANAGMNFVPLLLGAVLMWDFLTRVMQGVTMAFFEDVWSRNFLNIFSTPLSVTEYVTGLTLTSIMTSMVGLVVMIALATAIFGLSLFGYGIMLLPFFLVLYLFGIALGIMACGIVLRFGPSAEWFIWPIPALMAPFCCVYYPLSVLPHWMQVVSRILPPAHVFESMRAIVAGAPVPTDNLLVAIGLAILYIVLASVFFTRVYRHAIKSGLIARYSAESVS